jgi:uncharacterized protein (DUF885 family)
MLKIVECPTKAQQDLGDKFNIKYVYDRGLGGGDMPMQMLDTILKNCIEKTKA